jgi:flagellar biosynthesis chaperone FliJ
MSELELIRQTVARTGRRRRVQAGWHGFWRGFLAGCSLWLLVLIAYKLFPMPEAVLAWSAGAAALLAFLGLGLGLGRNHDLLHTARWVDDQHHFQERFSTALEVANDNQVGRWRDLLLADAAGHARKFDFRSALPFNLPRLARWCVVVLALSAGLGFVPEYRSDAHRQRQQEAVVIQEAGRQLTELVRRELQSRPPALEPTLAALDSVNELGEQLAQVRLDRSQALKELASVTDRIERQLRDLGRDPAMRRLDAGPRIDPSGSRASPEALQQQLSELEENLGEQAGQSDALEQMKQELQNLRQAATGLAQADGASADALRQELAQALTGLGQQAEAMGLDLAGLEAAVQALAEGRVDQVLQDLDAAFLDLDQLAQMAKAMKNLQGQLAEFGKTLAEQLEKGQGPVAYATLQRMIRDLSKADLTPEQLEQILTEVEKAAPVGSEYGKLGDNLKQAARQLQQGQRTEAAQSLAEAAEELKRLMEQLNDCQGLMSVLEGLKTGQMCIGNGIGWGLGQGMGARPGFKPGGRPGAGVGTWGDENLWMDAADSGRWDRSTVEQPDMDPRALTVRGEAQLNDAFTPTQVRGRISPGGPMPSIKLHGVSIKGQSRVQFEEQVAAAQTDAQSALSQDQVPRAYRGAVRDYFDDLK